MTYTVVTTGPIITTTGVSTQVPIQVGEQVIVGPPGAKGDPGPAGNSTYQVFEFLNAASTWTIVHTLGRFPDVTVLDASGTEVVTDIDRPSISQVVITWASPQTGRVFLI